MPPIPTIRKVPQLNIEHEAGTSFLFSFTRENSPNVPTDLTGRTYKMLIEKEGTDIDITGDTGTPTNGIVTFSKNTTEMIWLVAGKYPYTVYYTATGDIKVEELKGSIIVP